MACSWRQLLPSTVRSQKNENWWGWKSHMFFTDMWRLDELSDYHEILHAKTEHQDLCMFFFRNWFKCLEVEICKFFMLQFTWNALWFYKFSILIWSFLLLGIYLTAEDFNDEKYFYFQQYHCVLKLFNHRIISCFSNIYNCRFVHWL